MNQFDAWQACRASDERAALALEALAGMVQLSYHDHIAKEIQLPPQLKPFMPPVPEAVFKYSGITEEAQKSLAIKELMAIVRVKNVKVEDVKVLIEKIEIPETMTLEEGVDREDRLVELRVEVFVNCILKVGSRTIYHLDTILKRQLKPLKEICSESEAKNLIVRFTTEFWKKNPQVVDVRGSVARSSSLVFRLYHEICRAWATWPMLIEPVAVSSTSCAFPSTPAAA